MTAREPVPGDAIAAAEVYDSLFVPALFAPWAAIVAREARPRPGDRVLDLGCGTGVLARAVASLTAADRQVTGVDSSDGMLRVAARRAPAITWQCGTAESLPFPDGAFDIVVSQFALMFFDQRRALQEMGRVLAPAGRIVLAVWDRIETNNAYESEAALFERLAGRAAADAVRAPFGLGDARRLGAMLADAGFSSIHVDGHSCNARFPNIRTLVEADLRGWLPAMGVHLDEDVIDRVLTESDEALRAFRTADGAAEFATCALIASAARAEETP